MDSAQLYRDRATRLRELTDIEKGASVRQQLAFAALGFDRFAVELEPEAKPLSADETDTSCAS